MTGVQRYAHELIKALDLLIERGEIDKNKYIFELLAPGRGLLFDLNLKHIPLRKAGMLSGHAWEQFELPSLSKGGLLFCPGNTAPLWSLFSAQKTVVTVHSLAFRYFPGSYSTAFKAAYNLLTPAIFNRADRVITVSRAEKDAILKHYGWAAAKIDIVQNGAVSDTLLTMIEKIEQSEGKAEKYLLFVGSVSKGKNLQGVLEAVNSLNQDIDIRLVVVGETGKSFAEAGIVLPPGITDKVQFRGQVNDAKELLQLYKDAQCLVFPSFYEASSLPPIEAMACGCPVIVSDIPALRERCGDAAVYCNPDDYLDIAAKIRQVLSKVDVREHLVQKGLERIKHYTWENCARETFGVIRRVLYGGG